MQNLASNGICLKLLPTHHMLKLHPTHRLAAGRLKTHRAEEARKAAALAEADRLALLRSQEEAEAELLRTQASVRPTTSVAVRLTTSVRVTACG